MSLNLTSIPKPAVGFAYDGTLMGIVNAQNFLIGEGFRITSMSMNSDASMKFNVSIGYYREQDDSGVMEMFNTVIREGYIVIPDGSLSIQTLTQAQFESDYTINA